VLFTTISAKEAGYRLASIVLMAAFLLLPGAVSLSPHAVTHATLRQAIQAPVLKWQQGSCYTSWCETGWYSSPAVADLDDDGTMDVIGAAYTLFILNGEDGSLQWSVDPPGSRVWPGIVVADLDGDGDLEIVTASGWRQRRGFRSLGEL
jgi:hypothetical protein